MSASARCTEGRTDTRRGRELGAISGPCLLFRPGSEQDLHQESLYPPLHPRWPLFPQKPVQRSRASLGRPLWFFSMEPLPGLTVCCRHWCGTPRGLSLSPAWVLRPGRYLVSTHRHQWVQESQVVVPSLGPDLGTRLRRAKAHWAAESD